MKKFNDFYKRILAYAFDFLLIQLFVSILVDSSVINFQYKEYAKVYKEYVELYDIYGDYKDIDIKDCDDLTKKIENNEIELEYITTAYSEISDLDECNSLVDDINNKKMSKEEFNDKIGNYYYKMQKNSTFKYVVMIIVTYLYFVLFQGFTNGKTLGKKIMHVRVVPNDKKKSITYKQLMIRTILLGNVIYYLLYAILPWILNQKTFINITNGIYSLNTMFTVFMIIYAYVSKDNRGLHDKLANTKVIIDLKEKK